MKVIKPVTITDAIFISSTVGEPDAGEVLYNAGLTYAAGVRVILASTHKIYESLQASNVGHDPTEVNSIWWVEVSADSRWAMFDQVVSTATQGASPLAVTTAPGTINSLALLALVGQQAHIIMTDGGTPVYDEIVNLDGTLIGDWYAYFFEPYEQLETVVRTDLPPYPAGVLTVTLTGSGVVACGAMVVGNAYDIGGLQYGATAGITDYSRRERDDFGNFTIVPRRTSKRMEGKLMLENSQINRVQQLLSGLTTIPCVWIGSEDVTYATPLVIFGFYKSFQIEITYPLNSYCSLEIEGLI